MPTPCQFAAPTGNLSTRLAQHSSGRRWRAPRASTVPDKAAIILKFQIAYGEHQIAYTGQSGHLPEAWGMSGTPALSGEADRGHSLWFMEAELEEM